MALYGTVGAEPPEFPILLVTMTDQESRPRQEIRCIQSSDFSFAHDPRHHVSWSPCLNTPGFNFGNDLSVYGEAPQPIFPLRGYPAV